MKKLGLLSLLFLGLSLLFASNASAQAPNSIQVVKDYVTTANTGDFAKTLAFYADNAIVKNGLGLFVGKDQIAGWLKQDVQTTRATPQNFQMSGSTVVNTGTVSLARFKAMGIDPVQYRAEYIVENGKIRYFSPVVLLTPEQQAKAQAASAPAAAPSTAPETGASLSDDRAWIAAGVLAVMAFGLGLALLRRKTGPES